MIDLLLLIFLVVCAIASIRMRDLLSVAIVLGVYSLIMAVVWTRLNAVDVAFTEASVGAGITTMLVLAVLSRTKRGEEGPRLPAAGARRGIWPASLRRAAVYLVVAVTGLVLAYGTLELPDFGDPDAPVHTHVAPRYIQGSHPEMGIINFVTTILASYRGYDTLGETTVIFTAGTTVILLLRRLK
jgi:multicomponent Na+:H+ antiporter subunit B